MKSFGMTLPSLQLEFPIVEQGMSFRQRRNLDGLAHPQFLKLNLSSIVESHYFTECVRCACSFKYGAFLAFGPNLS
jgi:hypothetical protein